MAISKLTCPGCKKVLQPAKPLEVGKRVKCPRCGEVFTVQDEDEDALMTSEAGPGKKSRSAPQAASRQGPATAKKPPEKSRATGLDYERNTYGVVRDGEEQDQADKEERGEDLVAKFLEVAKAKDPRGPAQAMVVRPSNWMILSAVIGIVFWVFMLLVAIIGNLLPAPAPRAKADSRSGFQVPDAQQTAVVQKSVFQEALGPLEFATDLRPLPLILFGVHCLAGMAYGSLIVFGAVKIQNLQSRAWGIVASVLLMIPICSLFLLLWIRKLNDLTSSVLLPPAIAVMLEPVFIGIWNIMTLRGRKVIDGFEFIEDQD